MAQASTPSGASTSRFAAARGLIKSCHPGPCVTVTVLAAAIGWAVGLSAGRTVLVAVAVLTGQLSIGWLNDLVDRTADLAADRRDKPLAVGTVSAIAVRVALVVATAGTVIFSMVLGVVPGLLHLGAVVGGGWAYDLRLKRTVWSWLPYVVAFGALPGVVVLSLPGTPRPPWWALAAGALLGVAAHAANALPDIDDDRSLGVGGLPAALGQGGTRLLAAAALLGATGILAFAPAGPPGAAGWASLGAVGLLVVLASGRAWPSRPRLPFVLVAGAAVVDVVLLVARSGTWAGS